MKKLWRCPECKRTFANRNQSHSCGSTIDLDSHFKTPQVRSLFDALVKEVRKCGPCEVLSEKTRIAFHRRMSFLSVVVQKRRLLLGFVFGHAIDSPRFDQSVSYSPRNEWRRLPISDVAEIDDEVRSWIREAYDVGEQKHLS